MARVKQTVMQRSFQHMETREDFLEGDDLDIRQSSVRSALNMKALATRVAEARPGLFFERVMSTAENAVEIRPESGMLFGLIVNDDNIEIIDQNADLVHTVSPVPWTSGKEVWTSPFRKQVVLGNGTDGIWTLTYEGGTWTFADFAFAAANAGDTAQPYWVFEKDTLITPSATTGNITVTASKGIWTQNHVGLSIRYGFREILITSRVSSTVVSGTVVSRLPPSYLVAVEDASVFRVGEAVLGADTKYRGLITAISGLNLSIATETFYEGPNVGEELSGPAGSSKVTATLEIPPVESPLWDEPLISPVRGYPRAAGQISGRLIFLDFAQEPSALAVSSARDISDFEVGANDDDAIVRKIGDGAPRWLHAENMGDLVLFSDRGIYIVPVRENGIISPSTFNTVLVDDAASSEIKPVKVEDGIIFVDSSGESVSAVLLDGNVYLKWSVRKMTTYHNHLIKSPVALCGPSLSSTSAEKYMFVVNADGTLAAVSWDRSIRDEAVGFAPWVTNGNFINIAPMFGGYWAIVDRSVGGQTVRFLERFSDDAVLDCATTSSDDPNAQYLTANGVNLTVNGGPLTVSSPGAGHLIGETVSYYSGGWDVGDYLVADDGSVTPNSPVSGDIQIGFNFEAEMEVWPVELIESPRIGSLRARVMEFIVSVQNTLGYEVTCNGTTRKVGAYHIGDDRTAPPPRRTEVRRFSVFGNRDHPTMKVAKRRPGPFRVLALGQKVQG